MRAEFRPSRLFVSRLKAWDGRGGNCESLVLLRPRRLRDRLALVKRCCVHYREKTAGLA